MCLNMLVGVWWGKKDKLMIDLSPASLDYLPPMPTRRDLGIGIVGAGFIVRDCHLVAYQDAGFRVVGLTSRTLAVAREVAGLRGVPNVFATVEAMLDCPDIDVIDVAVPPLEQPEVISKNLSPSAPGERHSGSEAAGNDAGRGAVDCRRMRT